MSNNKSNHKIIKKIIYNKRMELGVNQESQDKQVKLISCLLIKQLNSSHLTKTLKVFEVKKVTKEQKEMKVTFISSYKSKKLFLNDY